MTMLTIEIQTPTGVLPFPDTPQGREWLFEDDGHWWIAAPRHEGANLGQLCDAIDSLGGKRWEYKDALTRRLISFVVSGLWLDEAERLCPQGHWVECHACEHWGAPSTCGINEDNALSRSLCNIYKHKARAWGKKETT